MKKELIEKVAWVGFPYVKKPVKAIVFRLAGLNGTAAMKSDPDPLELEWGHDGLLSVFPYYNPWAWMNGATVAFLDELVESLSTSHDLPKNVPVIATGGSMGGHAALTYTLKSKANVIACFANCPVCDLVFHFSERPDLPRTMHSAYGGYGDIEGRLREHSPLHQVAHMPKIPYLIFHGMKDQSVSKANHSDKFCAAMKALGHNLVYREEPDMAHCNPLTYEAYRAAVDFVKSSQIAIAK